MLADSSASWFRMAVLHPVLELDGKYLHQHDELLRVITTSAKTKHSRAGLGSPAISGHDDRWEDVRIWPAIRRVREVYAYRLCPVSGFGVPQGIDREGAQAV